MTEFTGESVCAPQHRAVHDGRSTNPGAQGDEECVVNPSGCPEVHFGERCAVGIVVDGDGGTLKGPGDQRGEVSADGSLEVRGEHEGPRSVHDAWHPNTDRARTRIDTDALSQFANYRCGNFSDRRADGSSLRSVAHLGRGLADPAKNRATCAERKPQDLRATNIDAERRRPLRTHDVDSTRAFNSCRAVWRIRCSARLFTNPGIGTFKATERS